MTVLGLDPGIMTGWALLGNRVPQHGTWKLNLRQPHRSLLWFLTRIPVPDAVVVEKPVGLGYNAMAANAQKVGVIMGWAEERGLEVRLVAPTTVKKFATGSGRATKEDMLRFAHERFGIVATDHEADALWLAAYGVKQYALPTDSELRGRQGK